MNEIALVAALVGIGIIHFGFYLSYKVEGGFKRISIKIFSIIVGFLSVGLVSFDVNISIVAGRYFGYIGIGYIILYQFFFKKRWRNGKG